MYESVNRKIGTVAKVNKIIEMEGTEAVSVREEVIVELYKQNIEKAFGFKPIIIESMPLSENRNDGKEERSLGRPESSTLFLGN